MHPPELDGGTTDSVTSSPRAEYPAAPNRQRPNSMTINDDGTNPRVRFMCSFGGRILPRPHDNQLRYVGGDTRIVAVHRHSTTYSSLLHKLSKLTGTTNITVKYQLPTEDLDSLITVAADEDVENMMEEYDRFALAAGGGPRSARFRLFLFTNDTVSRTNSSISSLLGGSAKREHWFLDALNGGSGLERGRSEVSSILSEVPDYLFGLDNPDDPSQEPKWKTRLSLADNVSVSDPGSPAAPVISSSPLPPPVPELPPVKTRPENPVPDLDPKEEVHIESSVETTEQPVRQLTGYPENPHWQYVRDPYYPGPALQHVPVYYVPGPVPPGNVPVHPVPIRPPYQPFPVPPSQVPVGFQMVPGMGQFYSGGARPGAAMDPYDGVTQPVYYPIRNAYSGMVVSGGEEVPVSGSEVKSDRVMQS